MSARVIPLPGAMTPAERDVLRERAEAESRRRLTRDLQRLNADLAAANAARERAEAQRVREMVVPFGKPPRPRAAKPARPTGPRPAA